MTAIVAWSVLALAGSTGLALSTASASPRPTPPDTVVEKGKLATDGVLTVGQPETVRVTKLPANVKLRIEVSPPPTKSCTNPRTGICISAPIALAPGTSSRTDGKGRATLTFTAPDHYAILDPNNLTETLPVAFTNGQAAVVRASGIHRERRNGHKELIFALAQSRAVVQTAPAP